LKKKSHAIKDVKFNVLIRSEGVKAQYRIARHKDAIADFSMDQSTIEVQFAG
jgi:hypothetical protein